MIRALAPIDLIKPSTYPFCQGKRNEVGRSRMPIARTPSLERDAVDLKRAQHIAHCGPRRRYRLQPATGAKANRTLPTSERRITRDGEGWVCTSGCADSVFWSPGSRTLAAIFSLPA